MKKLFLFSIVIFFTSCATPQVKKYPEWYVKKLPHASYEIIGYGEGATLAEAKARAQEDIAQTLQSDVHSEYYEKINDDSAKREAVLNISSKLKLQSLKVIQQEQQENVFYVAILYENLDFATKIKKSLEKLTCEVSTSKYLKGTPLYKKIKEAFGCDVATSLVRKDKAWHIKVDESLFLLTSKEFEELYVSLSSDAFTFKSSKDTLYDGDRFTFQFNSQAKGFITLFDVYESGVVTVLEASKPLKDGMWIPSDNAANYLEAGLVEQGIDTYDLYVAVFTEKPLNVSRFENADADLANNESAYKFAELLEILEGNTFSTLLLRTKALK